MQISMTLSENGKKTLKSLGFDFPKAGRSFSLHKDTVLEPPFFCVAGLHSKTPVEIGSFNLINGGSYAHVKIGRYCSLANNVAVGFAEHPIDRFTSSSLTFSSNFMGWRDFAVSEGRVGKFKAEDFDDRPLTTIGNDVWIGQGAFIKSGVTIGDGAIIAAHACVVKDVPAYAIVGGVPAKTIRMRFKDDTIERLQKLQWWKYCLIEFDGVEVLDLDQSIGWFEDEISKLEPWNPKTYTPAELKEIVESAG